MYLMPLFASMIIATLAVIGQFAFTVYIDRKWKHSFYELQSYTKELEEHNIKISEALIEKDEQENNIFYHSSKM